MCMRTPENSESGRAGPRYMEGLPEGAAAITLHLLHPAYGFMLPAAQAFPEVFLAFT